MKKIISIVIIVVVAVVVFVLLKKSPEAPAPTPITHGDWQTKSEAGKTFQYPNDFGTKYISIVDWPPTYSAYADAAFCPLESLVELPGQTGIEHIGGTDYCVTRISEGAAGSTYTKYTYARAVGAGRQVLRFTLRLVNCGNYNEPEMSACQAERDAFDPGTTIDQIFQTLK